MGANAVTTVPVYVAGETLTAADMNITNSGIPVFSGTATRDAAFGGADEKVLAEGQFCYIESKRQLQTYNGSTWLSTSGTVGYSQTTATTSVVSATALTVITLSATILPNRLYRVSGRLTVQPSTANLASHALYITTTPITKSLYYETNTVPANCPITYTGFACFTATELSVTTGNGTSVTFNLVYRDSANGGGLSTNPDSVLGANTSPQQLLIEDIGSE